MRLGIVVETHSGDHSADIVMTDDGARLSGVQVMTPNGSTRTGRVDLPEIKPAGEKWDITKRSGQDMIAVIDYIGRVPVVTGFLFPQVSQMLFKDPKVRFDRHQSDVYSMIDGDGNIELRHPSGTYIRLGETPDSAPVAGKNVDGNLAADRNTGRKVHLRVELAGNVAKLTLTPEGECTLELEKSFNLTAKENISLKADGNIALEAGGSISVKAGGTLSTESNGNTTIKAPSILLDGNVGSTGNMGIDGNTAVQGITSRGKDISSTHVHQNSGGSGPGGVPV